jgi:hypothetical protein
MNQMIDPVAVSAVQQVLAADTVWVYTTGRTPLADRPSLQFVADQAMTSQRLGFEVDAPEKFQLPGGVAQGELEDLFSATAGTRAEFALRQSVLAWVRDGKTPSSESLPPVLAKEMAKPVSVAGLRRICEALDAGMARAFGETAPRANVTAHSPRRG